MGDGTARSFFHAVLRPLAGALGGAFVLAFILSFTDFGIPASVGGTYPVIAAQLYQVMLGSIPDFNQGAVIAVVMLVPAAFGIWLLRYLDKLNFHYDKISAIELPKHRVRDTGLGVLSSVIVTGMLSVFAVMFAAPFMNGFPYDTAFTLKHVTERIRVRRFDGRVQKFALGRAADVAAGDAGRIRSRAAERAHQA